MANIVESKGWNWQIVSDEFADVWKKTAQESFYLLNCWKKQQKLTTNRPYWRVCLSWLEVLNNFITNHPDILVDLGRKTDLFYEHLELSDPLLFKKIELSKKNLC